MEIDKLDFGIEIIAGMKASAYGVGIEDGRAMAIEDTEPLVEIYPTDAKHTEWFAENKRRLHEQALFIADIAIDKLASMGVDLQKR